MLSISSRKSVLVVFSVVLLALLAASAASAQPFSRGFAWARIVDANGETVGAAALIQKTEEVRVFAWAKGLTPGKHGIHFHAVGRCDDSAFASAGAHFNPEIKKHGLHNPEGPHAGDLPNLEARESGFGILRADTDRVSLGDDPSRPSSTSTVRRSLSTPPKTTRSPIRPATVARA